MFKPEARVNADVIFPTERKRFLCPETTRDGGHQIWDRHVVSSHIRKCEEVARSLARSRFHVPGGFAGEERRSEHFLFPQGNLEACPPVGAGRNDAESVVEWDEIRLQLRAAVEAKRGGVPLEGVGKIGG